MRPFSISLLFCLIAITIAQFRPNEPARNSTNEASKPRGRGGRFRWISSNNMTEGEAEEYQRKFGINPRRMANRLQRLKKMGFQGRQTAMTAEDRSRMEIRRQKYGNLKVT
ncbi:hypothetical protein WR25_03663 isoform A, partial [Diploscapter pachys]